MIRFFLSISDSEKKEIYEHDSRSEVCPTDQETMWLIRNKMESCSVSQLEEIMYQLESLTAYSDESVAINKVKCDVCSD